MPENLETCCICIEKCIYFQNIRDCVFGNVKCIEKLRICVPNEQWEDTFNICNECAEKLDSAYNFVQLCLKSEEYRKKQLQIKQSNNISEELKDRIATEFSCYECNKSFRLKRTLGLHITRIHTRPKKNVKRKSLHIKGQTASNAIINEPLPEKRKLASNSVVINEIKTEREENKKLDLNIEINEGNEIENVPENKKTIIDDIKDLSDFEQYEPDNDCSDSSEDDVVIEKKTYKGKKRGRKLRGPQRCQYCELEFTGSDRYIHHVRSKHTFEKPFKCHLCDAKYYSQYNLNIHARKHRNEKPFVCSTCGKCFGSSNDLWQHNKIHDEVRQYACDDCERSFKTHSNLRTHKLQMHQDPGMWKFVCTVCGKKFPLNSNLIKHMRRHEGVKDYMCHLCDKKFVEKIDLQTHLRSHSNERHFKCTNCFKEYKKKETLRRHMKIEHNMGNFVVKKPEKKLTCPMCPKIFAFNNKLQRHILTHTGEKPIKCDCCDKRFRDNYDRNNHLRHVHQAEPKNLILPV